MISVADGLIAQAWCRVANSDAAWELPCAVVGIKLSTAAAVAGFLPLKRRFHDVSRSRAVNEHLQACKLLEASTQEASSARGALGAAQAALAPLSASMSSAEQGTRSWVTVFYSSLRGKGIAGGEVRARRVVERVAKELAAAVESRGCELRDHEAAAALYAARREASVRRLCVFDRCAELLGWVP